MLLVSRYGTISSTGAAQIAALVTSAGGASITYDGTNWSYVAYSTTIGNDARGVIIGDEGLVIGGTNANEVRFSTDGSSYSNVNVTATTVTYSGEGYYLNGTYVWTAGWSPYFGAPLLFYSTNPGVTWSADTPNGSTAAATSIIHDDSRWIVTTGNASPDSIQYKTTLGTGSWTGVTTPFGNCTDIAYDGTTYIATYNGSSVYTSTNLTSWTARSVGVTTNLIVTDGNGIWLASQEASTTVYKSTNGGVSWSLSYTAPAAVRGISYSNRLGKFVMSSNAGTVRLSTDGTTWTSVTVGTTSTLYGIVGA